MFNVAAGNVQDAGNLRNRHDQRAGLAWPQGRSLTALGQVRPALWAWQLGMLKLATGHVEYVGTL